MEKQQNTDLYLDIGEKSFPFSIVLPTNLPSSVKKFHCLIMII
jgi:hypothetical protein